LFPFVDIALSFRWSSAQPVHAQGGSCLLQGAAKSNAPLFYLTQSRYASFWCNSAGFVNVGTVRPRLSGEQSAGRGLRVLILGSAPISLVKMEEL
jgi:hypothetical protein